MKNIERNITLLKVFTFLEDSRFYLPITIIYFSEIVGSFTLWMSLFSIIMITQTISELPLWIFSDYIWRKTTLILWSIFAFSSVLLYAIAWSYVILFFWACFHWFARTFFSWNNQALLYETLKQLGKKDIFAELLWKIESYKELALGVSALAWTMIAWFYWLWMLFWVTTIPLFWCIIVSLFIIEPEWDSKKIDNNIFNHTREALNLFFKNYKLKRVSIASSIDYAVSEAIFNFIPVFVATVWSNTFVWLYRWFLHFSGFLGFYFSGYIIKKYWELRSLYIFSFLENILVLLSVVFSTILSPILLTISTLNYGIKTTAAQSLMQKEFSDSKRATMWSLNSLLGSLFLSISFVIMWYSADTIGVIATIIIAQIVLVIPLLMYYNVFRSTKNYS